MADYCDPEQQCCSEAMPVPEPVCVDPAAVATLAAPAVAADPAAAASVLAHYADPGTGGAGGSGNTSSGGGTEGAGGGGPGPATSAPRSLSYVADDGSLGCDLWSVLTGHGLDRPKSLEEMADDAQRSGPGSASSIDLVGHGGPGSQSVGRTSLTEKMSDSQRDALARMGATLTPDGEIVMGGCNVGLDPAMMAEAAKASGHSVRAGTARQLPLLGIEGPEVVVAPDGTVRRESNWAKDLYAWGDDHLGDIGAGAGAAIGTATLGPLGGAALGYLGSKLAP